MMEKLKNLIGRPKRPSLKFRRNTLDELRHLFSLAEVNGQETIKVKLCETSYNCISKYVQKHDDGKKTVFGVDVEMVPDISVYVEDKDEIQDQA